MAAAASRSTVVGGPPEAGTQVGQFDCKPVVRLALSRSVPECEDVCFQPGEIAGMRSACLRRVAAGGELLLGELTDRFQHRIPSAPRGVIGDHQRLAYQRVE